jgi:hypothetical protein
LHAIAAISWIASIAWFYFEPGWEPFIAVLVGIAALKHSSAVSDTPISIPTSEKTKSAREERNRQGMLELVRNSWVKGVLEQSLHGEVLIELGLEERRDAVLNRQGIELQTPGKPNRLLPPGTKVIDVFDEMGQTLLIIGEPGSGKTTQLLELARDTIALVEEDPNRQIPVVFNLSSWTDAKQPIADWLVDELKTKYYTPKKTASDWIENDDLLLLLDGLDEVLPERREACVCAINDFRHEHGLTPLVVCCRSEEHEALTDRLDLKGAVSLQPLTEEQVDDYLDRIGQELASLRAAMKDDPTLYELAQTPLMLSIMTLAYRGMLVHDLQPLETIDARRKHIFDNYVERMFKPRTQRTLPDYHETGSTHDRKRDGKRFSKEKTIHWLSWLAQRMSQHGQTIFLIEWMQPDWLPTQAQWRIVTLGVAVVIGLILGMFFGSIAGLILGLLAGLFFGQIGYSKAIHPIETLRFSWSRMMRPMLGFGLLAGLLSGLFFRLILGLDEWLLAGLFAGLSFGLIEGGLMVTRTFPNEGIHRSARSALLSGLFFGLPLGWLFGLDEGLLAGLFFGLSFGLFFGLAFGGRACIQHYVLRIMLWRNGSAPLNYVRFLDYAADHIFLRKVGGGYIFVHRLLLEYFASLEPEEEGG